MDHIKELIQHRDRVNMHESQINGIGKDTILHAELIVKHQYEGLRHMEQKSVHQSLKKTHSKIISLVTEFRNGLDQIVH